MFKFVLQQLKRWARYFIGCFRWYYIFITIILFTVFTTNACWIRSNLYIDLIGLGIWSGRLQVEINGGYGMLSLNVKLYDWPVPVANAGWHVCELEMNWHSFTATPDMAGYGPEPPPPKILNRIHWYFDFDHEGFGMRQAQIIVPTAWLAIGADVVSILWVFILLWIWVANKNSK